MKTNGSVKVEFDRHGRPWLIVGTADGYEAQQLEVVARHPFQRSWQAKQFASEWPASGLEAKS